MANWSDPRSNATAFPAAGTRSDAFDAGLRRYMLSVYNYMASGVLLTGIVAMGVFYSGMVSALMNPATGHPSLLGWVVALAPLGFVFAMSMGQQRMAASTLQLLFWGFAIVMGASLSTIFVTYTETSIAQAFFATAASFAGLSLYGYTTNRDLSAVGTFLVMGLVGIIVAMLLNLFLHSSVLALVISIVGVLVFAGLTAYDTQRTKSLYAHVAGTADEQRVTIMSALSLYLDFINMFLFILRLFGNRN